MSSEKAGPGKPTASDCQEGHNVSHDNASAARPCGVEDPTHAEKLRAREPGDPVAARRQKVAGRRENAMSGKSSCTAMGVVQRRSTYEAAEQGRETVG